MSTSWAEKLPVIAKGRGKHGTRKLKIRRLRFRRPDASQSDGIHQNQSAPRKLMLMKSGTPVFICPRLGHASGNLYVFLFVFFLFTRASGTEAESEEGTAKIQGHKVSHSTPRPASWFTLLPGSSGSH